MLKLPKGRYGRNKAFGSRAVREKACQRRTDRLVETRVVSVCLFYFRRVEKDQGVWELDGVIRFT